jgi:hypothetical protein
VLASNTVMSELGRPRSFFDFGSSIVRGSVCWADGCGPMGNLGLLSLASIVVVWVLLSEYSTLWKAFLFGRRLK